MGGLPRAFGKIQKLRRIAIPQHLLDLLGWKVSDQIMIEAYKGKLVIENLDNTIKPPEKRLYE